MPDIFGNSDDRFEIDSFGVDDDVDTGDSDAFDLNDDAGAEQANAGVKSTKKTSLFVICCGVALLVLVVVLVRIFGGLADNNLNKQQEAKQNQNQVEQPSNEQNNAEPPKKVDLSDNKENTSNTNTETPENNGSSVQSNNGWLQFSTGDSISFNAEPMKLTFTITKITNYVKVVDSNSNFMVKAVLTGALSGMSGTFEIDIPYSISDKVKPGDYFDVTVEIGTDTQGRTVVGNIVY